MRWRPCTTSSKVRTDFTWKLARELGAFGEDWSAVGCFDLCNLPNSGQRENALINLVNTIRKLVPQEGCKHYASLAAAAESRESPESLRLSEMPGVVGDADRHESRRT